MKNIKRIDKKEALKVAQTFTDDLNSLFLSTVSKDGFPFASYAPFVEDENAEYYICISGFVPHAHNLVQTEKAAIMFIEDECKAAHPFGRKRMYFDADAEKFEPDDSQNEKIYDLFAKKFGDSASFITKMPDFRIYKLTPKNGSLVLGFGSAYNISDDKKSLSFKNALHENKHEKNLQEKPV